ncbi:MAG TPA: DUF4404 family protein [Steroidobacteraceae bacterium]|nr:DUF4404 family protein [Steroidobacteraceae bacterium]
MESKSLQEQLAKLHAELAEARQVDPQVAALLVKVMADITRLVERPQAPHGEAGGESVADRLEAVAVHFEIGHPGLAASVRRFMDLLVQAGL